MYNWHIEAVLRLALGHGDGFLDLSLMYYHALLIFLSGNFDYFTYWNQTPAPGLSLSEVTTHLAAILELAGHILLQSKIPGVMLLFPLTVAGSRARVPDHRSQILSLLNKVYSRGFLVANRVKSEMLERWAKRDELLPLDQAGDHVGVEVELVYD
ncbi:hypothetical protein BJX64DRAFT_89038 [Aspergillus heterothallicus]